MAHRRLLVPARPRRPIVKRKALSADPAPPAAWPSYTGTSEYVGTSTNGRVVVFVDPSLGTSALANAQDLVADADRIVAVNDALFGSVGGVVNVIIFALGGATDGTGGADHMGCDYEAGGDIEVCASFGQSMRVSALLEAELSECAMGNNLCGESTGEALSRWCASVASGNALSDFATAPTWLSDGAPNFVDQVDATDGSPDSTGCGMAFLSWLQMQGYTLAQIAQQIVANGDGGTLCELYAELTGDAPQSAWPKFKAAIDALPFGVTTDDPFAGGAPPAPGPPPPPPGPTPAPACPTLADAQAWVSKALSDNWPT